MNRVTTLVVIFILMLVFVSCSNAIDEPISPGSNSGLTALSQSGFGQGAHCSQVLWGMWDVYYDPENTTFEAVPLRGAMFTGNVVKFIDGPPNCLLLDFQGVDVQPGYIDVAVDIGIAHPFPGLDRFTGFDVKGVFMGNGSDVYPGPDGFLVADISDQRLLNPDGYTRWFNHPEFATAGGLTPLFGYYPGNSGSPGYEPTASLNPYKYFTDGIGLEENAFEFLEDNPTERGVFRPGIVNYRRYNIRFPNASGVHFQYAVIANWEPNINDPAPPVTIDDFPITANAEESPAIFIIDTSDAYFTDPSNYGANINLEIYVLDWSAEPVAGIMEEYEIKCYASAWTGDGIVNMTVVNSGPEYCTFNVNIPVEFLASAWDLEIWIEISYPGHDYGNSYGVPNDAVGDLASYFRIWVPIYSEPPDKPGWARNFGNGRERCFGVATDDEGYSYITGYFDPSFDPCDFDPGPGEDLHDSNGKRDVFLSKFDTNGDFVWARTWGGGNDDEGHGVAIDPVTGDVYVTGFFRGTVDFDPGIDTDNHSSSGSEDVFLSKFDSDGNFAWAETWGSGENTSYSYAPFYGDCGEHVCVGDDGYVYVAGDSGTPFVRKLNSAGITELNLQWGGTETWDRAYGVEVSTSGDVYVCGRFTGTVDFNPGVGVDNHTATDKADTYLLKFGSLGNYEWGHHWGGNDKLTGYDHPPNYVDCGYSVTVDGTDDVYVAGIFYGTTDFDPGAGNTEHTSVDTYGDAFMSKFNPAGEFQWVRVLQGDHFQYGYGVEANDSGDVFLTGRFYNTVDFDTGGGIEEHTSQGDCDIYISKYDTGGNWQWSRVWGAGSYDIGTGVGIDLDGNAYMSGYFNNTIDFDPGVDVDEHTSELGEDCVLVKLLPNGYWE